jgi:hypothetical protein
MKIRRWRRRPIAPLLLALLVLQVSAGGALAVKPLAADSPLVLKRRIEAILAATAAGDLAAQKRLFQELKLPPEGRWFRRTFGDDLGARLSAEYSQLLPDLEPELMELFKTALSRRAARSDRTTPEVQVRRIDKATDHEATGLQSRALAAMKTPTALYTVRVAGISLWSFVHTAGAFRLVGKMRALP